MAQKLDRRRSRARRLRRAIVDLYVRGLPVETIATRVRVSTRHVEQVLEGTGVKQMFEEQQDQ